MSITMDPAYIPFLIPPLKRIGKSLGEPPDECEKEVGEAIEHASSVFHDFYGDRYGTPGSTFIDREENTGKLLRSTFPQGNRLTAVELNLEGFDGSPKVSEKAANFFLETFYDAIDRTNSRTLASNVALQKILHNRAETSEEIKKPPQQFINVPVDRDGRELDAALSEKDFPDPIRAAVAELSLGELSELMKARKAGQALAYAKKYIKAIDDVLERHNDLENRCAEELRTYRQRLLLAGASASSWQGDIEAGRTFWQRARDLGPIDSERYELAVATLFNIKLKDELRHLLDNMDQESDAYRKSSPLLAYLDKDWHRIDKLLIDAESADLLLLRVQARLQIIDPTDTEAIQVTANLLDRTDDDTILTVINLDRVWLTIELLQLVIGGYTPLGYNRRPLIDNLIRRVQVAIESTGPDSLFRAQALRFLVMAAELLRDNELFERFKNESESLEGNIRSSVSFLHDPALSPEKLDVLLSKKQVSITQAAVLKAELYRNSGQPEEAEHELNEALSATQDNQQKFHVLRLLAQHLRQTNRTEQAKKLIDSTSLRPADSWLLRAENLPAGKTPLDMVDEVEAFPLDVDVIEHLAQFTLSNIKLTSPEDPPSDKVDLKHAEEAVRWTARLIELLPSRSSGLRHAFALYAARRYKELLSTSRELDPVYAEQAAEFKAWALIGLGRRVEAVDCFISASRTYPASIRFVEHAARFLLMDNRPEEAANLLEPHIAAGSQDPNILLFYAQSVHNQAPNSQDHASRALDLLAQVYDLQPAPNIAQKAWETARAAGRKQEERRFFAAMKAEMPVKVVETEDDFFQAMQAAGENHGVLIEGGLEYLAKMFREDRKRSESLDELLRAHMLAYGDYFQHSGRSWELWTYWTQQFEKRSSKGKIFFGEFLVLADWPSIHLEHNRQRDPEDVKLFLDQTAVLTLGVLGPNTAEQILTAVGTCYVHADLLDELHQDLSRISGHLRTGGAASYVEAVDFLSQSPSAVVNYSEEIESAAPNDPRFGACRVDLGVAIQHNALYVTDLDNSEDWSDEANQLRISSATLLVSLNAAGKVTADEARNAADKCPHAFEGWDTATPRPIPETIVFDEYSILDWVDSRLADALGDRVKVGPWTWMRISEETGRQEAMELAYERLENTINVLQASLEKSILVKIETNINTGRLDDVNDNPSEEASLIQKFWPSALKSLQTAHSHGLQLWADDRFYPLLLRFRGPRNIGAEIDAIRDPFVDWAKKTPPISTTNLLDQLSSAGSLTHEVAQDATAKLFTQGYRMANPVLLSHTLRQFPVPKSGPLTTPFQRLVDAITEIPSYPSEKFKDYYGNSDGFIRVASMGVAGRLIVGVWEAEGLSNNQRCALANAFLEAVEYVFQEASPNTDSTPSDQTSISFWKGIAYSLQMMPSQDETRFKLRHEALCWLGKSAASRAKQRENIVRALEDNVLDFFKNILGVLDDKDGRDHSLQSIGATLLPALTPLISTSLINTLTPLMRRTVGMLAQLKGDGRMDMNYYATPSRDGSPLKISEEEIEQAAADVLRHAVTGDPNFAQCINATDLVFAYTRPVPKEWIKEGSTTDEPFLINVRCSLFALLWADPPDLRETIIHLLIDQLSILDPYLADRILVMEDNLLSDDTEKAKKARNWLSIALLWSGYFDLQRDLTHAVQRFRMYSASNFFRFVGYVGEDAASALFNRSSVYQVRQMGQYLVPTPHYWGRALLTDQFDDEPHILEYAEQLINAVHDPDGEESNLPTLTKWLEKNASLAENTEDPFVAAWALRSVLLILSTMSQNPELNINEQVVKVSDWATNYIETALAGKKAPSSELAMRMEDRRCLASAALLLAAFASSGKNHFQVYSQKEDPVGIWLEMTWLLSSKLQISLVGLRGGLAQAAESAVSAVRDLGLKTTEDRVHDAFDPLVFGLDGDDIGIALTLTAMFKVVRQLPESNEHPIWWTDTISSLVKELENASSEEANIDDEELDNRFGLVAPFRVRILARQLTVVLAS